MGMQLHGFTRYQIGQHKVSVVVALYNASDA